MGNDHDALLARVAALEARLSTLEDTEAIQKLTRMYGYYLDKALWRHVLPLFTDDCEVEISALGVYAGREQAEVLFRQVLGKGPAMSDDNGLVHGRLFNHLILQGIVHVDDDGRHARGRWRAFVQVAEFGKSAVWGEGPYEMEYRKEDDGRWRIRKLHFFRTYHTPFDQGWAKAASPKGGVKDAHPPSRPPSIDYDPYPAVFVPPFHYRNPITGE
jgi:hypothetical protein